MIELNSNTNGQYSCPMTMTQSKGLVNFPGQNNCFLNCAVQVLWHLDCFRNSIDLFSGHYCTSATTACVFCSLSQLFSQLKNSTRNALNADQLRRALAHTFSAERRFQLGGMDDAIECFEHILQRLHFHCVHNQVKEEECNVYHCLSHGLFSMRVSERRFCTHCSKCESRAPYNQYVQYVSTPALIEKSNYSFNVNNKLSFGSLVRLVSTQGEIRDCSVATCKSRVQLRKTLLNAPKVLAIGLNYENERPSIDQIADVFKIVDTFIRLSDVFEIDAQNLTLNSGDTNCDILHLVGLVTYYGKHYCTFFYNTQLGTWLYLDDANVKEIGNCWSFVVEKCKQSHFQPLMLLYASSSQLNSIDTNLAPKAVYQVPSNLKSLMINRQNQENLKSANNNNLNNRRSTSHLPQIVLTNNTLNSNNGFLPPKSSTINSINQPQFNEDVPDSPFAKSSTASSAYFSDYCSNENEAQYISKRAVQNIIHAQKFQQTGQPNNVNNNNSHPNNHPHHFHNTNPQRNSSSSLSDSFLVNEQPEEAIKQIRPFRKELKSADAGYDSYSLSSSDSYPSIGGSAVSNGTAVGSTSSGCSSQSSSNDRNSILNKSQLRSIKEQIGEQSTEILISSQNNKNSILVDSQLLELINNDNQTQDKDKLSITILCSESDILLLKSHEKERENDLKTAATLSETAAQKARAAMDVPLTNPNSHLLMSAKMKHSIAVMRSASLMKRIKELEQEEKKSKNLMRLSRENIHQSSHTRTHSLSSSHLSTSTSIASISHQRRASQERLDENAQKNKQARLKPTSKSASAVQLYGTLPKKQSTVKQQQQPQIAQSIQSVQSNNLTSSKPVKPLVQAKPIVVQPPVNQSASNQQASVKQVQPLPQPKPQQIVNQLPLNLSEQTVVTKNKNKSKNQLNRNASTCSTNSMQSTTSSVSTKDSTAAADQYAEIGDVAKLAASSKQHKIRKKLLIGSFIKRKNKSLPDLREDNNTNLSASNNSSTQLNQSNNKSVDQVDAMIVNQVVDKKVESVVDNGSPKKNQPPSATSTPDKQIAKVSRKGFHPQSIYENQKSLNIDLTNKLNQMIIAPKPIPMVKPIDQVDGKLLKLKEPPVNIESKQMNKMPTVDEQIVDLETLPPPPEDFLEDLREKKQASNASKEEVNNQINENLANEIREKQQQRLTNQTAVRNLASRFEQINMVPKGMKPVVPISNSTMAPQSKPPLPPLPMNANRITKTRSASSANDMLEKQQQNMYNNLQSLNSSLNNNVPLNKVNYSPQMNKLSSSNTGLRVAVLGSKNQSPTLIYKNSSSSANQSPSIKRMNPPDYNTTMQRLNMIQQHQQQQSLANQMQQQGNKSIDSNYSLLSSLPSSLNSSLDSPFKNGSQNGSVLPQQQIQQLKQQQYNMASAVRNNKKVSKKSVSFSDEVVLVSHPNDQEEYNEVYYPNPLLDKVLKKNKISIS